MIAALGDGPRTLLAVVPLAAVVCPWLYRWLEPRVTGWVEGPKQ